MSDLNTDSQLLHERILVLRAQMGDRDAFNELVILYQERLTYYVHRLIQDWHQSLDILQQVWLDVFRKLKKLRSPAAFRVWLYRIAHDRVVTHIRRAIRDSESHELLAVDTSESANWNDLDLLENAELVHYALSKLPILQREIMTLRFLEELNVKEIAYVTKCKEGTAKSRLHYAKSAMRRIIEEERGHV